MADEIAAMPAAALATSDAGGALPIVASEAPALEPKIEPTEIQTAEPALAESEAPTVMAMPAAVTADAPRAEIKATPAELGTPPRPELGAAAPSSLAAARARGYRPALLATTIVLAAGLGVVGGALGAYGLTRLGPVASPAASAAPAGDKTAALQSTVARMQTELSAVRTSVEVSTRTTNGQFAKITERFDRIEKAQAERAAKFSKAVETLERLEKRAEAPTREVTVTGSVPAVQPAAVTPAQAPQVQQPQRPILDGWVVRNVYRGTALVQSRRYGAIDIEAGDILPGVGRVESIKKQDGRWVVVTSRGLIVSMR